MATGILIGIAIVLLIYLIGFVITYRVFSRDSKGQFLDFSSINIPFAMAWPFFAFVGLVQWIKG